MLTRGLLKRILKYICKRAQKTDKNKSFKTYDPIEIYVPVLQRKSDGMCYFLKNEHHSACLKFH